MPPQEQPRRRRQHKRSRNGCYTCKQRHIRCDEQVPICTNCLVRGGACGYPSKNGDSAPDSNGEASGDSSETLAIDPGHDLTPDLDLDFDLDLDLESIDPRWATLGDFDFDVDTFMPRGAYIDPASSDFHGYDYFNTPALPQSADLTDHPQFQMLTHSLVPQSPSTMDDTRDSNNTTDSIKNNTGLARSCLLLSAMHYAWVHGSLGDAEETFLYHKGEAIREINLHISSPAASDMCANTMAALALAETGIGDVEAAQAHLNGLVTLVNWQHPEDWREQLNGLFHNIILVYIEYLQTGSL
ncbi:zinc c6 finger domain protein [Ophiostoma piceae UAMH 11346]|uniref:Zinc c6 finger domain protein n=1 Tax=Ophiostoma piceae (strain UAMH 11346) TaxID=1262450 RepID=S3BSA4_OPHP1|nr:zinc c6 finger domain protein [Ophiostoma piceae UAMH 11346]